MLDKCVSYVGEFVEKLPTPKVMIMWRSESGRSELMPVHSLEKRGLVPALAEEE